MDLLCADPYALYIRYLPYNPPNLHLRTTRATNAYYLPALNQGVTYNFTTQNLSAPIKFASGPVPMRMAIYRSPTNCAGNKTVKVDLQFRIGGVYTTVSTVTQNIAIPTAGNIVPVFNINGLQLTQQYQLNAGDAVRLRITQTAGGGRLCLVNEYPINGTDADATHIVLQTAPTLSVNKSSTVVSDPVNSLTNPKRIPGAVVRYTITVSNSAGASGSAQNVTIDDPIPNGVAYVAGSIVIDGVAQTDAIDGDMGAFSGGSVKANLGTMAPGSSHTILFDTTVN